MADESETPVVFPGPQYQPEEVWMLWDGEGWVESIDYVAGHPSHLAYGSEAAATAAAEKHLAEYDIECVPVRIEPRRLAVALAESRAECERLRAACQAAYDWLRTTPLVLNPKDLPENVNIVCGLAAALAPPAEPE